MAGMLNRKLARVEELEDAALVLSMNAFDLAPLQYTEHPDLSEPMNAAWNEAVAAAMRVSVAMERLGDLLRARAGLSRPGPTAELLTEPPRTAGCTTL